MNNYVIVTSGVFAVASEPVGVSADFSVCDDPIGKYKERVLALFPGARFGLICVFEGAGEKRNFVSVTDLYDLYGPAKKEK